MKICKRASRIPIYPLFIAASLLVGWLIPEFYAWTDSDQSRPSPLLWQLPLSSAIVSIAFCLALPWLPVPGKLSSGQARPPVRFSLRTLMMLTASFAVMIALLVKSPLVISGIVCAGAYACVIIFGVRNPQHRLATATLLACMSLPYAWVVGYKELGRLLPTLAVMFAGMPAFVPAALIGRLFGQNMHDTPWLRFLLTAFELAIGIWMIGLGPKRTIAYLLLVTQISVLGSLFFYMAVRA